LLFRAPFFILFMLSPFLQNQHFCFVGYILYCSSCRMFLFGLCLIVVYYYEGTCATSLAHELLIKVCFLL
jgi:hypothetical protein